MKMIYNVIKEQKRGSKEGKVVASFESSSEADDAMQKMRVADQSNDYSYFVGSVQDAAELPINIDNIHPTIKE